MTKLGRKLYLEFEKLLITTRKESPSTRESHRNSARLFAAFLTTPGSPGNGPQDARGWRKQHWEGWIAERTGQVEKGQREKDMSMLRRLADAQNRPGLVPDKNDASIKRGQSERNKPKNWVSQTDRDVRQARLEAKSERYGLAAKTAMLFGERRAETLTSRWILIREGKTWMTNYGTKNPAEDLKQVDILTIRRMYAPAEQNQRRSPLKDAAFEDKRKGHLYTAKEGVPYLLIGGEAKNGTKHLSPIQTQEQYDHVKKVNAFCMAEKTKNLYPKRMDPEAARKQFSNMLAAVGMTKAIAGYTLHTDRHEYVQRSTLPDQELIRAVGHGDVRKLDAYRPKK
ncbi:MAG: hypothetical protein WA003_01090 [Desulfuromonadaceae bacterium]